MGVRETGKSGQIWVPLSDGIAISNAELTKQASYTIQGTAYANRVYKHASGYWNKSKALTVTMQGIIGEASIQPTANVDEVQTTGIISYYKDNSGTLYTAAIDTSVAVTRPAGNVAKWNLIVLDMDDGAITAVPGTDSADTTFLETFGAGAGEIPLVAVDKLIIGAVKLTASASAVVSASEIAYSLSTGQLLQERSDIPSFEFLPLQGGVLLSEALIAAHTGAVTRKIYASFTTQAGVLAPAAHTTKWNLAVTNATVSLPAQGDVGAQADLSGPPSWSGGMTAYATDDKYYQLAANKRTAYVRLYRNRNVAAYYEGAIIITNMSETCDNAAAITNDVTFTGDGTLEYRTA